MILRTSILRKEKRGTQEVVIMQLVHYGKTCVPAGKLKSMNILIVLNFELSKNILLTRKVCFSYHCLAKFQYVILQ